jgi:opine dehydrogenase
MKKQRKFAVLGTGAGGQVMAAHLAIQGFQVNLYKRPKIKKVIDPLVDRGGIYLTGALGEHFIHLNKVTTDIKEAVEGVDIINIVVPAFGHVAFFEKLISVLEDGQIVLIHPGYLGSIVLARMLKEKKIRKRLILGEAQTLLYSARIKEPGHAWTYAIKKEVQLAAFPGKYTEKVIEAIKPAFPQFIPARDILETFLNNIALVFHPAPTILNAGRIESTEGKFKYYRDIATESVGRFMEAIDEERLRVVEEIGIERVSIKQWLIRMYSQYGAKGESLREVLLNCRHYENSGAPSNLKSANISQDVPYGLVPMISLADNLKIPVPRSRATVQMACYLNETDYWAEGLNLRNLGIHDIEKRELIDFMREGEFYSSH